MGIDVQRIMQKRTILKYIMQHEEESWNYSKE